MDSRPVNTDNGSIVVDTDQHCAYRLLLYTNGHHHYRTTSRRVICRHGNRSTSPVPLASSSISAASVRNALPARRGCAVTRTLTAACSSILVPCVAAAFTRTVICADTWPRTLRSASSTVLIAAKSMHIPVIYLGMFRRALKKLNPNLNYLLINNPLNNQLNRNSLTNTLYNSNLFLYYL